jgi:hypothetical protein
MVVGLMLLLIDAWLTSLVNKMVLGFMFTEDAQEVRCDENPKANFASSSQRFAFYLLWHDN